MLQLPIGYDDFGAIKENKLDPVDKSLFPKEVIDDRTQSIVITRPRRFGKTSNLSLLHYFLSPEVMGKSTKGMFDHLKIAQYGDEYMQHQGKYPVIFITFKDTKASSYPLAYASLSKLISDLYLSHVYLLESEKLSELHKTNFHAIVNREADEAALKSALYDLMNYLYIHHGIKPWLLIDEYDTPIQSAYIKGYYNEMIEFMRGMLGAALKNNPYLNRAVITGILRIAKESLFSGLNNLKVYSILHSRYSEYFGFTEAEVDYILTEAQLSDKVAEVKQWYNGYRFGETTIYNPWSIANCVDEGGDTKPYWVDTSDNQLIKDLMKKTPLSFKTELEGLIAGRPVEKIIDEQLSFQYLDDNPDALWNLLLMAGYLSPSESTRTDQGILASLAIPNHEVRNLYRQIIEQWLSDGYGVNWYNEFIASLLNGRIETFKEHLEKVLLQIVSCHDFAKEPEAFYHGLLLGFMASLNQTHEIKSNRESGLGRYDIVLIPKDIAKFGIVIELKVKRSEEMCSLDSLAEDALKQIEEKHYTAEFEQREITNIIKIGIGLQGKRFALTHTLVKG